MEREEMRVWICYGCFVFLGLLVFIIVSSVVRVKNKRCEKEQAFIRMYNSRVAQGYAESRKDKKERKKDRHEKESFSLFDMLI